jgi:two-component system LytT family response regulator
MKALIVDDERLARLELRRLLELHASVEIAGEARDVDEALALIRTVRPDVLFLDIEMPGASGFDLLDRLDDDVPHVIFTTAFDQHAVRAFEVNALDYLLKPIASVRLSEAIGRIVARDRPLSRLFLRDGDRCWIVDATDIALLESEGNYTRVHLARDAPLVRRTLSAFEARLDPRTFFRANRRQIINLAGIEDTHVGVDGAIVARLRGGRVVPLSRRQSGRLRDRLQP